MTDEFSVIAATTAPGARRTLIDDLAKLGLADGATVIVHTAMSRLGWIAGGAQAVVEALFAAVGPTGTIVMPTQSGQLSDPSTWSDPAVPSEWVDSVRAELPAYDRHLTPTRGMGHVVECFRQHPATIRSGHPLISFAAHGPLADDIIGTHPISADREAGPLGRLYDFDAQVLLLGVDHANNTSLHLAEQRATWTGKRTHLEGAPMMVSGARRWVTWDDLDVDDDDFARLGEDFAAAGHERSGPVGSGVGRLFSQRTVVDFAVAWMTTHRPGSLAT